MQTLGLSGESKRSDGRLKSIFWPTVENAWDVNYLGQQGFCICCVVAVVQLVPGLVSGNLIVLVSSAAAALVFMIGGVGVREAKWPAAAMVFALYLTNILYTLAAGSLPGVLAIICAGILLSNLRASFLAAQWKPVGEGEDRPTRFNETFWDKLVDQWPAKAWPVLQIPFFALSGLLLLLTLAGVCAVAWQRINGVRSLHL